MDPWTILGECACERRKIRKQKTKKKKRNREENGRRKRKYIETN
jgi:hypothetical protein